MTKKAVASKEDFDSDLTRRVDPLSHVSASFPAMHTRFGTTLPEALRPTKQELEMVKATPGLSEERRRELQAELDALLNPD